MLKLQPSAFRNQVTQALVRPLDGLVRRRVSPNLITTIGALVNVAAGLAFFLFQIQLGGALVLLGGFVDIVDGHVAKRAGLQSVFGSFYDSTTDRIAEVVVLLGVMSLYLGREPNIGEPWMAFVVAAALAGSMLVSYTRAKAEALGIDCKVGLMQRAERILLLGGASLLFGSWNRGIVLTWVMLAMAVLTNLTAMYRIYWVYRYLRTQEEHPAAPGAPRSVP
ncbi:MAG TPA: CDP-alcohol phosphatidyltransferase family protein [Longimicrobiaceae bacterium]|nr:CDP-alcohol phosphatidyltransferase family protein [Longimicrobiaceae bacterium]